MPQLADLYRYPVKGLSPERLQEADLAAGGYFPGDRLYAVENGPSGFDPAAPEHQPKLKYLMLMRNEALARLRTRYDDATATLTVRQDDRDVARGDLRMPAGRAAIEAFFEAYLPAELRGAPKVLAAPDDYRFTDSRSGFVSLINLASVAAVEAIAEAPVDRLRFRGNLYLDGMKAWAEFDLLDKVLRFPSGAALHVTKRIERCAATTVDPTTGIRDIMIPRLLMKALGHVDCGIYARIIAGGRIAPGDAITIEDAS